MTRVESDWVVKRDDDGAPPEFATSRSKCSTPISSASSASIDVGTWVKVRCVAVPSYTNSQLTSMYEYLQVKMR